MKITTSDLRRAIFRGGDISTFAPVYQRALKNPPVPTRILQNEILQLSEPPFISASSISDAQAALSRIDLRLLPLPPYGKNIEDFFRSIVTDFKPDIITLDTCPIEYSARGLYAASLPCALGLPVQAVIRRKDTEEVYASEEYYPGNIFESAALESWLNQISLWPVGQPHKPRRLEYIAEQGWFDMDAMEKAPWEAKLRRAYNELERRLSATTDLTKRVTAAEEISFNLVRTSGENGRDSLVNQAVYIGSRILDIAINSLVEKKVATGRKTRLLAVVDLAHYVDVKYIISLFVRGILDETYVPPDSLKRLDNLVVSARTSEKLLEESEEFIPDKTAAQELFQKELESYIAAQESAILSDSEAHCLIIDMVDRTRRHPDILRGVSVRGSLALEELSRSLAEMSGGLNREALAKAALITLPPRIFLRQKGDPAAIISEIAKEVLYGFRFSGRGNDPEGLKSLKKIQANEIFSHLKPLEQPGQETDRTAHSNEAPAVISENAENREALKHLEALGFLKKDEQGQYQLTKKALEILLNELDEKLQDGQITQEEYNRQKSSLLKARQNISKPQYQMSSRELAQTVIEMMDAQDKLWEKEVNFSTLHVYYHVKENSGRTSLMPQKRDYQALKRLIDDMGKRNILEAAEESSGFVLTGMALNLLLKYLVDKDQKKDLRGLKGKGTSLSSERKNEIRRFSTGDAFRDISVRHTLNEIARQKKRLSEVKSCDFRVYLKQHRQPQSDIIICLDTSGSMGFHQKMTYARLAAAGLVQAALAEGDRVGLVVFNDYGQVTVPLTDKDQNSLLDRIAASTPRGNTNIGDGIKSSLDLLFKSNSSNQKCIVLVTDGQPTAISESTFAYLKETNKRDLTEESALLETRRAVGRGARVSVVHVAAETETSSQFIKDIAGQGKGKIRRVSCADDLKAVMR